MSPFRPTRGLVALILADAASFAAYSLLPQFELVSSPAAASALELDGGLVAASYPPLVWLTIGLRVLSVLLLLLGRMAGVYVLAGTMLVSLAVAALGGLSVFTAIDMLALTLLYFLDGFLLARALQLSRERTRTGSIRAHEA